MVLPIAYFPPVEYFALLCQSVRSEESVYIDSAENYVKQTWRNRTRILTANGPMDLNFPIVHNGKRRITEVGVDYSTDWLRRTEYAVDSAYFSSPFFEYYRDSLFEILDSRPETLWELDERITGYFCEKIGIAPRFIRTGEFPEGEKDYRGLIHPKRPAIGSVKPYWQVFRDKFGYVGNLSVMDLLFNEGPESITYLELL